MKIRGDASYDYIVAGAGSAGCVLAKLLSDNPDKRVLLLEAGGDSDRFWVRTPAGMAKLFFDRSLNWNYFTDPISALGGRKMYWPRGKGLGGSSSINGMIFIRGHRDDFDNWERLGNPGWGYESVLPYFKQIEHNERGGNHYRGTGGPLWISDPVVKVASSIDFIESARQFGIPVTEDLNGELHDGVGFMQYSIRDGRRDSAYFAFLKPVMRRTNLTVLTGAKVQRLLFDGKTASGVEIVRKGSRHIFTAAREVIVAAGALNSPQLLMLSGIGRPSHLAEHGVPVLHEAAGVGSNLQDHFYVHTAFRTTDASSYNRQIRGMWKYLEGVKYLLTHRGYLALGTSQVAAFIKSRPELDHTDLQISFRPMTFTFHPSGHVDVDREPGLGVSVCLLRPRASGVVELKSANPDEAPSIKPNFLAEEADARAVISGVRQIRRIMSRGPVAGRVVEESLPGSHVSTDEQLLEFMANTGNSAFHPAGTCKMGSDSMSVVDERLRVRGLERLRVVDASVMPVVTTGNTNAPTLMIAAKGAAMILEDALPRR